MFYGFMVNVGQDTIHGLYGNSYRQNKCNYNFNSDVFVQLPGIHIAKQFPRRAPSFIMGLWGLPINGQKSRGNWGEKKITYRSYNLHCTCLQVAPSIDVSNSDC